MDHKVEAARKKLKIWNGRTWYVAGGLEHVYVCAKSRADAMRLLNEWNAANGSPLRVRDSEMKIYWVEGCWGVPMAGIEPERGLWGIRKGSKEMVRLV